MSTRLNQPVRSKGGCLPCCWRPGTSCTPSRILTYGKDTSGDPQAIADVPGINFNGRGFNAAGNNAISGRPISGCGSGDQYVTFLGPPTTFYGSVAYVDIWAAYAAGVWSSSCYIDFFYNTYQTSPVDIFIRDELDQCFRISTAMGNLSLSGDCPSQFYLAGRLTVNDNGTYSFA